MLSVDFQLDDRGELDVNRPVEARERRGHITYRLARGLFLPEGVAGLNSAVQQVLAGRQWFQLWKGEIVSMDSPATLGGYCARIHRGPLVDQAAGPNHW